MGLDVSGCSPWDTTWDLEKRTLNSQNGWDETGVTGGTTRVYEVRTPEPQKCTQKTEPTLRKRDVRVNGRGKGGSSEKSLQRDSLP